MLIQMKVGIPRLVASVFSVFALLAVYLLPKRLCASQFFFCIVANKYESGKFQYNYE